MSRSTFILNLLTSLKGKIELTLHTKLTHHLPTTYLKTTNRYTLQTPTPMHILSNFLAFNAII